MDSYHSYLLRRFGAGLIDAFIVMMIGGILTYIIWLLEASMGLTDLATERWTDWVSTLPVYFVEGISALTAPICAAHFLSGDAIVGTKLAFALVLLFCVSVANWLYHALLESSSYRSTLGKMLVRLVVEDENGRRVSFKQATLRHFHKILSAVLLFAGFFAILFDSRQRALHDRWSHCIVNDE